MSTPYQKAVSATLPENWPTFIELDEVRVSLSEGQIQPVDQLRVRDMHEAWPVQETAAAFSFDRLPFETLRVQSHGLFNAEYEDEAVAECVTWMQCQDCGLELDNFADCDCLCHKFV